jgi:NTP pyrophosphatase (non-canonical NTP hydrolase)
MTVLELQAIFYQDRPRMAEANSSIVDVFELLLKEVDEAKESIHKLNQGKGSKKDVATELSDILLFTLASFRALGFDPDYEAKEKIARNCAKYPGAMFSKG